MRPGEHPARDALAGPQAGQAQERAPAHAPLAAGLDHRQHDDAAQRPEHPRADGDRDDEAAAAGLLDLARADARDRRRALGGAVRRVEALLRVGLLGVVVEQVAHRDAVALRPRRGELLRRGRPGVVVAGSEDHVHDRRDGGGEREHGHERGEESPRPAAAAHAPRLEPHGAAPVGRAGGEHGAATARHRPAFSTGGARDAQPRGEDGRKCRNPARRFLPEWSNSSPRGRAG